MVFLCWFVSLLTKNISIHTIALYPKGMNKINNFYHEMKKDFAGLLFIHIQCKKTTLEEKGKVLLNIGADQGKKFAALPSVQVVMRPK